MLRFLRYRVLPFIGATALTMGLQHAVEPLVGNARSAIAGCVLAFVACLAGALVLRRLGGRDSLDAYVLFISGLIPMVLTVVEIGHRLYGGSPPPLAYLAMGGVCIATAGGLERLM